MEVMTCRRNPCSEYFNRFLATWMVNRVLSNQKFFNSGWVSCTPMEPLLLSVEFGEDMKFLSAMLPVKSYCKPHGSKPLMPELNESDLDVVEGIGICCEVNPPGDTLKSCWPEMLNSGS